MVRNGDLLATKRHKVHKKFESRVNRSSGLWLLRFFVARKNGKQFAARILEFDGTVENWFCLVSTWKRR